MNGALKALIGAACIAIIAAVGHYFFSEYSEAQARSQDAARVEDIRAELFRLADAKSGETDKVRKHCRVAETGLTVELRRESHEHWRQIVKNCRYFGYL